MRRIDNLSNLVNKDNIRTISGTLIIAMIARLLSGGGASPAEAEQSKKLKKSLAGSEDNITQLDPAFLEQVAVDNDNFSFAKGSSGEGGVSASQQPIEKKQVEQDGGDSELETTMSEERRAYLESNFSFFAEEVEGGIAPQVVSGSGITVGITNGSAAEVGVPVPAETTEDFLLHVRADIAVQMAEQQGIELTHDEALRILQSGESFGFTGEVFAVPSRALRTIASGGGNAETVEFNPDLPELGGTQVTVVYMREGFFHDGEEGDDRIESRRGLSSGNLQGNQRAITVLPDGSIMIAQYRDNEAPYYDNEIKEIASLAREYVGYAYLLSTNAPLSSSADRYGDFSVQDSDDRDHFANIFEWGGIDANTTADNFDLEAVTPWVRFEQQPEQQ